MVDEVVKINIDGCVSLFNLLLLLLFGKSTRLSIAN